MPLLTPAHSLRYQLADAVAAFGYAFLVTLLILVLLEIVVLIVRGCSRTRRGGIIISLVADEQVFVERPAPDN